MATSEGDESPRLRALRGDLRAGRSGALEAFWAGVAAEGTPLVEPVPEDDRRVLVTFLARRWAVGKTSASRMIVFEEARTLPHR